MRVAVFSFMTAAAAAATADCSQPDGICTKGTIMLQVGRSSSRVTPKQMALGALPGNLSEAIQKLAAQTSGSGLICKNISAVSVASGNPLHPRKYGDRARSGQCNDDRGMWAEADTQSIRHFKYKTIVEALGLGPGHQVVDWGTGCGKELSAVAEEYKFHGVGVDIEEVPIAWANANLHGQHASFCLADGSALPFADNSVDAIISNAALYHLNGIENEKRAIQSMLKVLRPGGCAWMAWLGVDGDPVHVADWRAATVEGATMAAVSERLAFGHTEYDRDSYSLVFCKNP